MKAQLAAVATALSLWLVDRSRYEEGTGHCLRGRYLQYHAGPHGYGWQRKAQSIPTVTGTLVHAPLAAVLAYVAETDRLPSDEVVYTAITQAQDTYRTLVEKRGLATLLEPALLTQRVNEQLALLEGLVWTWVRQALPGFHAQYRVLEVEREDVTVYGCTCGLGDGIGTAEAHDARACHGIGWMTRGDALCVDRLVPVHSYHDFKTTGIANLNWEAQWKYRVQLVAGVLGAEQRLGIQVDQVYIHALIKGRYESEWNPETRKADGPKFQNSPLVYGWRRPGNPPLAEEDWAASYNYVGEDGKAHRLTKDYKRTGIWALPPEVWQQGCVSPGDYWSRFLASTGKRNDCYRVIGPIGREDWKLKAFLGQLQGEEQRWQAILWALYDLQVTQGKAFASAEVQAYLDRYVPQNRGSACHNYYGDTCPMVPVCERHSGWEEPGLMGFIARRPHHDPELQQAIGRGLLPPTDGEAEEYEE